MAGLVNTIQKANDHLRKMEKELQDILRLLHEQKRTLEVAVENTYVSEMNDPRVRLLGDALYVSHLVDQQLAQLNLDMQHLLQSLQKPLQSSSPSGLLSSSTDDTFESRNEREEAARTSVSHLQEERSELETLYDIGRTLNSTLAFDDVLYLVMDKVIDVVKAEHGFLVLVNPITGELEFAIARDKNAQPIIEVDSLSSIAVKHPLFLTANY